MTELRTKAGIAEHPLSGKSPGACHLKGCFCADTRSRDFRFFFLFVIVCSLTGFLPRTAFSAVEEDFTQKYQSYQRTVSEGKAALDRMDYQAAIDNYTKAIEISPFVASHYYERGIASHRKGEEKKAEEDFSRAIILNPRMAAAYTYRGLAKMKGGDQEGALKDYSMALGLNPRDPSVHNNLAWLYATAKDEKLRDKVKALEHAVRAVEMTKEKNAGALDTLARVYRINGRKAEAIETEKMAIRLEPDNKEFKENLRQYETGGE